MAGNLLFYYFGDDEAYYRTLIGEFSTHTKFVIDFRRVFETEEAEIQSLFLKVFEEKPACIFIDFSKNTQDYLHLARIIARTPMEHKLITVGLVDYLSPSDVLMESQATGVELTHIKSAETYDVIFDVTKLIDEKEISQHGFATAALKEEWEAGLPVKVGYIFDEGLHFETDYHIQKGSNIRLKHCWSDQGIVPSQQLFVFNTSEQNLFYHFHHSVDAQFLFVDEFVPPEGMEEDVIAEKTADREEKIALYREKLTAWMDKNYSGSLEKKAKVMVVDRKFHFYDHCQRTDKHAYTIRCLPYLNNDTEELNRMQPQVIAFALENTDESGARNTGEKLVDLIKVLKNTIQDTSPFVVVFNCQLPSKELQQRFDYPHIMGSKDDLSVEVLERMAEVFEKKFAASQVKSDVRKVFLKKSNPASVAELQFPITVVKLSETDLVFQSHEDFPPGTNLHITSPVDMFIHVLPMKGQGKVPEYYGLIHSLGEDHKRELRRFVNAVFFRDHDAQVNTELEEFKKLNEAKLQERQDAEKKARAKKTGA